MLAKRAKQPPATALRFSQQSEGWARNWLMDLEWEKKGEAKKYAAVEKKSVVKKTINVIVVFI